MLNGSCGDLVTQVHACADADGALWVAWDVEVRGHDSMPVMACCMSTGLTALPCRSSRRHDCTKFGSRREG